MEQPQGTVTLLFSDIEGSTWLLHELGPERYAVTLDLHRRLLRDAFARHGGYEVDEEGDAFFVAFGAAADALAAAMDAQNALAGADWEDGRPIRVRIGLHTGTPAVHAPKYVGLDVHKAARIMAAGHGGQTLLSSATRELAHGCDARELGEFRLKDFDQPVRLFQLGHETFPPLKTISNTNLPRPASSFVGRDDELAAVLAVMRSGPRLVTLTGPGGAGKTRLAIEAAAEVVGDYPAGVFWVGLAPLRDPALVLETISQTLGGRDDLAGHIGTRRVLLLLDNLEQVIEAAPGLAGLLEACPNLGLLCTSRESLRISGERTVAVLPLTPGDAAELFTERAQVEHGEAIERICERLDHLPLAIELAAARVPLLPPERLLERLERRLPLLTGGTRDAPDRQQTLRAAIEWSHELLDGEERELFRRLAVFAGGCSLESAETVAGADLDTLQSLVEKSLVRQTGGRFWMLETIREYASEKLGDDTDSRQLRSLHAHHYLELAERVAADNSLERRPAAFRQLDAEHDNLRAARSRLHDSGDSQAELRLLCALSDFWQVRGLSREPYGAFADALSRDTPGSTALRARALAEASDFARELGEPDLAASYSEESLELFRKAGDQAGVARALHELGETRLELEDYDRAVALFEEAIAVGKAAGIDAASSIGNLGWAAALQGDYERAARLSEEAVALVRRNGNMSHLAVGLENLAEAEIALGRTAQARIHLTECLERSREAQYTEILVVCLNHAAALLLQSGDVETAARLVAAADAQGEQLEAQPHPVVRRRRDDFRRAVQERSGQAAYELEAQGRELTVDEASALALERLAEM
jgi:predicted ATPase/class 3 adenylate cyclase